MWRMTMIWHISYIKSEIKLGSIVKKQVDISQKIYK